MKNGAKPKWLLSGVALATYMTFGGVAYAVTAGGAPTHMADSASGITQAVSSDAGLQCQSGYVLSGGTCVPIGSILPPSCSYGQVLSGGKCVDLTVIDPPPTSCPSGQVLSGGACVPLVSQQCPTSPDTMQYAGCPAGQTGSMTQTRTATCNASTNWLWQLSGWTTTSNSCTPLPSTPPPTQTCGTSPDTVQSVACPAGQTGTISQTRTATCNASTGYVWSMGAWSTTSSTCTPVCAPSFAIGGSSASSCGPTTAPACQASYTSWGNGCSGTTTAMPSGSTSTVTNTAYGVSGSATYLCSSGSWVASGSQTCGPAACPATNQTWSNCSGSLAAATIGQQGTATNTTSGYTGTGIFNCSSSGTWTYSGGSCNAVTSQCPTQTVYWGTNYACNGTAVTASQGNQASVNNLTSGYTGSATFVCGSGGNWQYAGNASCDPVPVTCPGGTSSFGPWGSELCTNSGFTWSQTPIGGSVTVPANNANHIGSVSYTCTASGWQQGASSCQTQQAPQTGSCPGGYLKWTPPVSFLGVNIPASVTVSPYLTGTGTFSSYYGGISPAANGTISNVSNINNPLVDCNLNAYYSSANFICSNGSWQYYSDTSQGNYQTSCGQGGL